MALIRYGRWARPELERVLGSDCPVSRYRAAYALGKIGNPLSLQLLCDSAVNDSDSRVRYDAIVAVGDLGTDRAIPLLRRLEASGDEVESALATATRLRIEAR